MLEKYRSIPITLDLANQYVPNTTVSSGLDTKGRTIDLTITNGGVEADLTDQIVWLAWHHHQVGNTGIRKFTEIDPSKGKFQCHIPTNMAHLGYATCSIIVTNDGPEYFLPSLEFTIRIQSAIFRGDEADTCDDFSDLQEAMGNLKNVLDAAVQQLTDQSELFSALLKAFEDRYTKAEANRDSRYEKAESTRQSTFESNESTRQSTFDAAEAKRKAEHDKCEQEHTANFNKKNEEWQREFDEAQKKRQEIYEQEEGERQNAENVREAEENKRIVNERQRQTQEGERVANENARKSAEAERQQAYEKHMADIASGKYDGTDAGFGELLAFVDGTIGNPSVKLETSGTNQEKNMTFNFSGLKGEPGVSTDMPGLFSFAIVGDDLYVYYSNEDNPPNLSINEQGHLMYDYEEA